LLTDVKDVVINGIDIFVDIESEKPGSLSHRLMSATFPLNTDGIDPSGRNIYISNVTITNFDDAIAVKPSNRKDIMS
jgi:polygalacturonase